MRRADRVITRYNASCEGAFVIYYNNIGFLILEINYNDMSMEDINNFTYRFKRMGDSRKEFEENKPLPHTDKQGFLLGNIWEIVNGIINTDIVKPFFQITNHFNSECNIMQFINAEDEVTDEVALHIGRGYNADFVENKSSVNNSAVDMNFEPYDYINWRGCQSVLACITSQKRIESNSSGTEKFMRDYFPNAIKNDYLYMYLMLLFQRYTLLYYIDRVIKSHNDCNMLEKIYNEVLTFKQCLSFNIVSNEFTYQNIYNEMIKVLNINELFADINDLSEKVMSQTEKRQRSSIEILSTCFMILGVVDIIPLLVAVIDEPSGANVTGFCITAALVVSIIIYYIREKRKSKG